ncbi:MAG: hypothetical protein AB1742_05890 [bacterium]
MTNRCFNSCRRRPRRAPDRPGRGAAAPRGAHRVPRAFLLACLAAVSAALYAGCARYAPAPPVPQPPILPEKTVLGIHLETRENITPDFYYYAALELIKQGEQDDATGPRPLLSGEDRARDWDYYIRVHAGVITELIIDEPADLDSEPEPFAQSTRYRSASIGGKTIDLELVLDELSAPVPGTIWLNFVTSRAPLSSTEAVVEVIDNLRTPYLDINTALLGVPISGATNPNVDTLPLPDDRQEDFPADIASWSVRLDLK